MRWINRLEIVFTTAFVLGCLVGLAILAQAAFLAFAGGFNGMGVQLRVPGVDIEGLVADGVRLHSAGADLMVTPLDPSLPIAGLYLLDTLPALVVGLVAIRTLTRALHRARSGDRALFSHATVRLLRRLGWTVIGGTLIAALLGVLAKALLSSLLLTESAPVTLPAISTLTAIVAGAGALAVSEIIRRGLALLEEVEATI
ncbi:DUF2975 domain-containing protein [Nonomuraea sp. NPDC050663]|uniref:DUF2975 domain-containing protein n=1 Tax=Nonomuraea sp. NPDC050663 TaxID=3364370 RepID=UPI00378CFCBD